MHKMGVLTDAGGVVVAVDMIALVWVSYERFGSG